MNYIKTMKWLIPILCLSYVSVGVFGVSCIKCFLYLNYRRKLETFSNLFKFLIGVRFVTFQIIILKVPTSVLQKKDLTLDHKRF